MKPGSYFQSKIFWCHIYFSIAVHCSAHHWAALLPRPVPKKLMYVPGMFHWSSRKFTYSWVRPAWTTPQPYAQSGRNLNFSGSHAWKAKVPPPLFRTLKWGDVSFPGLPAWKVKVHPTLSTSLGGSGWPDPAVLPLVLCFLNPASRQAQLSKSLLNWHDLSSAYKGVKEISR